VEVDGLRLAALQRPPSWSEQEDAPPRGAWCGCCGRHRPGDGGRWWAPRYPRTDGTGTGPGWCCSRCHPPAHLTPADILEAVT
jgi:hypothetical protein